jgi:hypothetical protein
MLQINVHVESYDSDMICKTLGKKIIFYFLLVYKWVFGIFGNTFT